MWSTVGITILDVGQGARKNIACIHFHLFSYRIFFGQQLLPSVARIFAGTTMARRHRAILFQSDMRVSRKRFFLR
jgi:hypothetical protein